MAKDKKWKLAMLPELFSFYLSFITDVLMGRLAQC